MKYKLLSIDLDDTLLNSNGEVSKKNIEYLDKVYKKGVKIVICSGRPLLSAVKQVERMNIFHKDDFLLTFNGAAISNVKGKLFESFKIEDDVYRELVSLGRKYNIDTQVYDEKNWYIEKETESAAAYEELTKMKAVLVDSFDKFNQSFKILYNSFDYENLENIKKEVDNKLGDKVLAFYSKPHFLEILNKNSNKGLATKYIADHFDIAAEEVIAIGDSYNDSYMIEYAGLGVCVKNGREDIKKIANYVTDATNNEDAIAEVIKKYVLQ